MIGQKQHSTTLFNQQDRNKTLQNQHKMEGRRSPISDRSKSRSSELNNYSPLGAGARKVIKLRGKDQEVSMSCVIDKLSQYRVEKSPLTSKQQKHHPIEQFFKKMHSQQKDQKGLQRFESVRDSLIFNEDKIHVSHSITNNNNSNQKRQQEQFLRSKTLTDKKTYHLPSLTQVEIQQVSHQSSQRSLSPQKILEKPESRSQRKINNPCIDVKKLVKNNSGYFLHMLKKCACFVCKCGLCKCDHSNIKWTFKGGFGTVYRNNFKKQPFEANPIFSEANQSSLKSCNVQVGGISNYKGDYLGREEKIQNLAKAPDTLKSLEPFSGLTTYALNYRDFQGAENDRSSSRPNERISSFKFPLESDTTYKQNYSQPPERPSLKNDSAKQVKLQLKKGERVEPLLKGYDQKIMSEYHMKYLPNENLETLKSSKRIDAKNFSPSYLACSMGNNNNQQLKYKSTFKSDFSSNLYKDLINHSPKKQWKVQLNQIQENGDLEADVLRLLQQ